MWSCSGETGSENDSPIIIDLSNSTQESRQNDLAQFYSAQSRLLIYYAFGDLEASYDLTGDIHVATQGELSASESPSLFVCASDVLPQIDLFQNEESAELSAPPVQEIEQQCEPQD